MTTKPFTFVLSIGGLPVSLRVSQANIYNLLKNHYREFAFSGEGANHLEFVISKDTHRWDTTVRLDDHRVIFDNPSIQGQVDLDNLGGTFHLAVEQPFEAIDYCLRVVFSLLAFRAGGLMIHAAGISKNCKTYLFAGHSGAGKSTVSSLSKDALVLNDDLVIAMREEAGWRVYGTPFWNPTQVKPTNDSALLEKIYFLVQDTNVFVEPISFGSALAFLVSSVPVLSTSPQLGDKLLARCASILSITPHYKLHFLQDETFWKVVEAPT
jgi:hypothetical protein